MYLLTAENPVVDMAKFYFINAVPSFLIIHPGILPSDH